MLRAAVLALIVVAAGCGTGPGVRADRIRVGDCYQDSGPSVERFDVVPCEEPHDNEVFLLFDAPGGRYPGKEALTDLAATRCTGEAFTRYVGVPLEQSDLRTFEVLPTRDTWERDGDREIICVLYAAAGRVRGSARAPN